MTQLEATEQGLLRLRTTRLTFHSSWGSTRARHGHGTARCLPHTVPKQAANTATRRWGRVGSPNVLTQIPQQKREDAQAAPACLHPCAALSLTQAFAGEAGVVTPFF